MNRELILSEGTRRRVYWTMVKLGLGQTELEMKADVGSGTLSNFFKGTRGNSARGTRDWLLRIADALDVDYGWLNTGRRPDPKKAHMDLELKPIPPIRRGRPPNRDKNPWVATSSVASPWEAPVVRKKR